jgi:integration host factor subunit beta
MTKADLIEKVSLAAQTTLKESGVIVEAIFNGIVKALNTGDKVEIRGFGSFHTRQRQPRIGRNPRTGKRVDVLAKKNPYFKVGKELKDVLTDSADPTAQHRPDPSGFPAQQEGNAHGDIYLSSVAQHAGVEPSAKHSTPELAADAPMSPCLPSDDDHGG